MADWGAWDYGGGNGMRVGFENSMAAVSNGSSSVKLSIEVWTDNQYTYADNGEVMNWGYDFSGTTSTFNNNQGATATKRFDKSITHTYSSTSYGTSPGSFHFSARVSGTYNGVEPRHEMTVAIPARPYATPSAPDSCAAARVSDTATTVTWQNNPTSGKPYSAVWLERYIYNYETWTRVGTLSGSAVTYSAATITNRKYSFRVQADNSVGTSGYSQIPAAIYTTPAAPTAPVRTQSGTDQVLTWALDVGYTEYATEVWRAVNGTYALLTTVASGVTTYTDTTSLASTQVKYKFRTKTIAGTLLNSAYSAETTQTAGVLTAPSAPTLLKPSSGTIDPTDAIQFTWQHNPTDGSAQSAFQVQYRHVGDGTWIQTGKITSTASSWTMPANTAAKGKQVEWQVQTWGGHASASPFSTTATWTTSPIIAVKYPVYLDLTSGRLEADSTGGGAGGGSGETLDSTLHRVATGVRTVSTTNSTVLFNAIGCTIPNPVNGKTYRVTAQANVSPDTAGMYITWYLKWLSTSTTATDGSTLAAGYTDHRIVNRTIMNTISGDFVYTGTTGVPCHVVLVITPNSGGALVQASSILVCFVTVDELTAAGIGPEGPEGPEGPPGPGMVTVSATASCTSSLTVTSTETDVPGMAVTVNVGSASDVFLVTCDFDVTVVTAGAGNFIGRLNVGGGYTGNATHPQAIWNTTGITAVGRNMVTQTWRITGLTPGMVPFKGTASDTVTGLRVNTTHSTITVSQIGAGTAPALPGNFVTTELPAGVDLNTLTTAGIYSQSQTNEATTALNYPLAYAGMLEIFENPAHVALAVGGMIWQRYTTYGGATNPTYIFQRSWYNSVWSAWKRVDGTNGDLVQSGIVSITPVANTPTKQAGGAIQFPKAYASPPVVVVTAESLVPGSTVLNQSCANITATQFDAYIYRINTTATNIHWMAIGTPA